MIYDVQGQHYYTPLGAATDEELYGVMMLSRPGNLSSSQGS
jgi:hypothetical protein